MEPDPIIKRIAKKRYRSGMFLIALLFLFSSLLSLTACTDGSDSRQPDSGNYQIEVLRLAGGTDWGAPNPYLHTSRGPGNGKKNLVFASLLEADEQGPVGWMAESWTAENNQFIFKLHDNARFHDGKPLTSADVAFTIEYYRQHPPVDNPLGHGGDFLIDQVEIIDDLQILIRTKEVTATTLQALGSFTILPRHIWEGVSDPLIFNEAAAFIGSGAYRFVSYDGADGTYAFAAFADFCAGRPAAAEIRFVPVSDELLAFEQEEIDIAAMPPDLADRYLDNPEIGVVDKANDFGYKMLIQFEKLPQFLDLELRQALYYAMDRQAVVDKVFRGLGQVGSAGYAPSGSEFYNPDCLTYDYDPDLARERLAGLDLEVTLLAANAGDDLKISELIKLDLEAAGIMVNVIAYDSAVRDDMVNNGQYELALVGNGGWGGRAPAYLRTIFSDASKNQGGNPHSMGPIGYSSQIITRLAEEQALETDLSKRKELFKALQMEISREIPLIVVATRSTYSIYRKQTFDGWMKTYDYQQTEQIRLSYMDRR